MSTYHDFFPCTGRTNNGYLAQTYVSSLEELCLGVDYDGQLWKLGGQEWERYDPDLLELALHAQLTELKMIEKLLAIPSRKQRNAAAG